MAMWCDGSVMVGNSGEVGWGNGWGDGVGDHTSMTIVPTLTQRNAFQSRGGWGVVPLWWTLVTLSGSW